MSQQTSGVTLGKAATGLPARSDATEPGSLVHPTQNDIILGRGVLNANHPGNQRFYAIIDQHIPLYNAAKTRAEKTAVVQRIYEILTSVGRFVKDEASSAACVVVDANTAKKKISHAIRFRRGAGGYAYQQARSESRRQRSRSLAQQQIQQPRPSQVQHVVPQIETVVGQHNPSVNNVSISLFADDELDSVLLPHEEMTNLQFEKSL